MKKSRTGIAAIASLLLVTGCSKTQDKPVDSTPYDTSLPMKRYMADVMQHAAQDVYRRQGYVSDATGSHSLFPKNEAEWNDARNAGLVVAEMTNELLIPGRRVDEPEWYKGVAVVRAAGRQVAAAATKKDEDAFFDAAGKLDAACEVCHARYAPAPKE